METVDVNTDTEKIPPVPAELPLLPLKDTVVYPLTVYPLVIGKEKSIKLINDVTMGDKILGLTAQKQVEMEVSELKDINLVGTMARILQMVHFGCSSKGLSASALPSSCRPNLISGLG